jgi:hypothetical protein
MSANRLRTFLTMLGMVIGVGAVILMMAIGEGAQQSIKRSIDSMGSNLFVILSGSSSTSGSRSGSGNSSALNINDANAVGDLEDIAAIAPISTGNAQIIFSGNNWNTSIIGTSPTYFSIRGWNVDSGELSVDGKPKIQFFKNYLMPSSPNGTPDVQPLGGSGDATAFSDVTALKYFADKLRIDSKVPTSRFGREDSGSEGTITFATEGVEQEEIRFSKFVNRLRSIYQEILIKPLWVQFCLDFPEKKNDYLLKSEFGLDYIKENNFTKGKEMDVLVARKDQIIKISGLKNSEGKPYFSMDFVVDRFLGMDGTEKENNKRYKKIAKEKKEKGAEEEGKEGEEAKEEFKL